MFFSPDLLSKRDSGFGLLWLAATLGSKSTFKKLPKRSVMTADISQLCRLIAAPAEPLALRFSSNLLVGAARVYRVKQDIFMSDVTTCFNSLKRVEHEFRSMIPSEGQLQMAQPSAKSSAVTLRVDPRAAFSMEFDTVATNWDDYLNLEATGNKDVDDISDDDYHSIIMKGKRKAALSALPTNSELLRATACTLPENHDFLLANSFDASFGGSGTTKLSSSQTGGFGFDDTFDGLDIGEGVGDDLVRELGEGWGAIPIEDIGAEYLTQPFGSMNFNVEDLDDGIAEHDGLAQVVQNSQSHILTNSMRDSPVDLGGSPPSPSLAGMARSADFQVVTHLPRSPVADPAIQPIHGGPVQPEKNGAILRKAKRTRIMLDIRTELTDEELKATRMHYLDKQNAIRCELEFKKFEKIQVDLVSNLLWNAPDSVHAKELVDFWVSHFKAHVEARSGLFDSQKSQCPDIAPRPKRRKIFTSPPKLHPGEDILMLPAEDKLTDQEAVAPMDVGDSINFHYNTDVTNWGDTDDYTPYAKNLRSSEEPGQPRRASHPPPALGEDLGLAAISDTFHSQRSALFPWDMAGSSSSISVREGVQPIVSDRVSVEHADARLRGSSASRRGSSLPSLPGNLQANPESPTTILPTMQSDDDFVFDVPGDDYTVESRPSEANRMALEKNSYNFLEYAKMQYRSLPSAQYLAFDDVVPRTTSTARVAAAALYHCLVLATKDLLRVNQEEPYGRIDIRIM